VIVPAVATGDAVLAWIGLVLGLVIALVVLGLLQSLLRSALEIHRYGDDILDAGLGLVVALVVWGLLEQLRRTVNEVDRAVSHVWTMGKRVAQNTQTTYLLATTKQRGLELREELEVGVRAIEKQTAPIGPVVGDINGALEHVAAALEDVAKPKAPAG
jgi:hypothetical protein